MTTAQSWPRGEGLRGGRVVTGSFREAYLDISGESWLADLARASLVAADAKFSPQHVNPSNLRISLQGIRELDAHDSYVMIKAVQDATAKLGHIIRNPRSETSAALAADRNRARLIQNNQFANVISFGFPITSNESANDAFGEQVGQVETLAERAAGELVSVLPRSAEDDASLDAVLGQRPTIRNAVNDIVNAVPLRADAVDFQLTLRTGETVGSVISAEQAQVLKTNLREARIDTRTVVMAGRLDGVRTSRRLFYLELPTGTEIRGAVDLELLEDVRINLNREVIATLEEQRVRSFAGKKSHPFYRLIKIESQEKLIK